MQVKGKTIAVLGDSITYGAGASCVENGYVNVLARISGATVLNYGISGTRYAKQTKSINMGPDFDRNFCVRVSDMAENADIVLVMGGTNDFGHGDAPFGEDGDRTNDTFIGSCHQLYSSLIQKYPDSFIAIITPLHRTSELNTVNEIGLPCRPLKDYVNKIREIAEYYSLPVIDLYKESGMQPRVEIIKEKYMPDGLHPSDAGAKVIAEKIYAYLLCH